MEEGELVEVEEGEVKSDDEKKPSAIAAAAKLLKQVNFVASASSVFALCASDSLQNQSSFRA